MCRRVKKITHSTGAQHPPPAPPSARTGSICIMMMAGNTNLGKYLLKLKVTS